MWWGEKAASRDQCAASFPDSHIMCNRKEATLQQQCERRASDKREGTLQHTLNLERPHLQSSRAREDILKKQARLQQMATLQ